MSGNETIREMRREERSSHAVYGQVIVTATLVADRLYATDALMSLLMLWGSVLVLVVAHTYSALIAEIGRRGRWLTYVERHMLIRDNIPLAAAVVLPTILLVAAGLGWIGLAVAMDLSVLLSLASLFALGAYQARMVGASLSHQLAVGLLGGAMGIVVVAAEVVLAH